MDQSRALQAITVFGTRLRGQGSDLDTPELHAALQEALDRQLAFQPPPLPPGSWRSTVAHRLPPSAQAALRRLRNDVAARRNR